MKTVYPALFTKYKIGGYMVSFPDLPGCNTEGDDLYEALYEAEGLLIEWLEYLVDEKFPIPTASHLEDIKHGADQFVSLIRIDILKYAA